MDRIANARLQENEDSKVARNLEQEVEARWAALEERLAANNKRKLALEKKLANKEHERLVEEERKLFFMDTSNMDEKQKEYINLACDEMLAKKRISLATNMKAPTAGYGGYAGMGAPAGVFGTGYGGMGAPAGMFGGGMGGIVGMGLGSMADMGGMGLGGFGGVFGGTSASMAGIEAPSGGVYGAMEAPPGGFVASMDSSLAPSTHGVDEEEAKNGDDFENRMSDDLFAFAICKYILHFIMSI
jgi:hypothetical protein